MVDVIIGVLMQLVWLKHAWSPSNFTHLNQTKCIHKSIPGFAIFHLSSQTYSSYRVIKQFSDLEIVHHLKPDFISDSNKQIHNGLVPSITNIILRGVQT